jgi:hypothetical protein
MLTKDANGESAKELHVRQIEIDAGSRNQIGTSKSAKLSAAHK